jgi:hypothetical protein
VKKEAPRTFIPPSRTSASGLQTKTQALGQKPNPAETPSLPLVERCILLQWTLARDEYQQAQTISRRVLWRTLLPFAMEHARKFRWEPDAAALTE